MFSAIERMIAMRYLRARRQEGFISVIAWFSLLGIALGVATLIIVMSVMNGFRQELLTRILGVNGHLSVYAQTRAMPDYEQRRDLVAGLSGVVKVTPTIEGQVMASANGHAAGAVVRGVAAADLQEREIISGNIAAGSLDGFTGTNVVAVGSRFARNFRLGIGDRVTLISPQGKRSATG